MYLSAYLQNRENKSNINLNLKVNDIKHALQHSLIKFTNFKLAGVMPKVYFGVEAYL